MRKGYVVLDKEMVFDPEVAITKEDIVANMYRYLGYAAKNFSDSNSDSNSDSMFVFSTLKGAKAYANEPDDEKADNEGFPVLKVEYPDAAETYLFERNTHLGEEIEGSGVYIADLTFLHASTRHLHSNFSKIGHIDMNMTGVDLLEGHAASYSVDAPIADALSLDKQEEVLDNNNDNNAAADAPVNASEAAPEAEDKKPSRLSALFTRRNLVIASAVALTGAALLTPMGMAAAVSAGSFVAKSAAGVYFGVTAAVLAGSIGLGLLARKLMNRKSSTEAQENIEESNEARSDGQFSPEVMAQFKSDLEERNDAANDDVANGVLNDKVPPALIPAAELSATSSSSCCSANAQQKSELEEKKGNKATI